MRRSQGFTLLEVILAVTIMSLVVLTLHMAFSQASRAWRKQDLQTDTAKRLAIVSDMLGREFESIRPYNFQWEKGSNFFFATSTNALFYVTKQGFGSERRREAGLYFACLYLAPRDLMADPDEEVPPEEIDAQALYLCKTDRPTPWMLEEFHRFLSMDSESKASYTPDLEVRDRSVFLVGGITEGRFSCKEDTTTTTVQTNATEAEEETDIQEDLLPNPADTPGFALEDLDVSENIWAGDSLPGLIQLSLQLVNEEVRLIRGEPEHVEER